MVINVDTYVDVSNKASAVGLGAPPVYTAPVLQAGGIGDGQRGDGSIPLADLTAAPTSHLTTIRGHLLLIYSRAVVISPGTESVGGVNVGTATSSTVSWKYLGRWTDAPIGEGTQPGATGGSVNAISLQWNNAEMLNGFGKPVDEQVPITMQVNTTYPDGHVVSESVTGNIAVTIYYVALGFAG